MIERGKNMNGGIFYSRNSKGVPRDIITWHDQLPLRIFIHSRENDDTSRSSISISVITVGMKPTPPSEEEKTLRIKLAQVGVKNSVDGLNSTNFRNLSIGKLIELHSTLISTEMQKSNNFSENRISLVSDIKSTSSKSIQAFKLDSEQEMLKLGGNSGDAVLIAKIYTLVFASGSSKVTKRTADFLGTDLEIVRTAVRIARRNGWLTSLGHGKSGGFMTDLGENTFLNLNGPYRMQKLFGIKYEKQVK